MRASSKVLGALVGVAALAAGPAAYAVTNDGPSRQVKEMRSVTARFHDIAVAEAAGYVPFVDVKGISCIEQAGMGGMGVHYVNPKLIADPAIDPKAPEALVYSPAKDGTLHLAALEYLVAKAAWDDNRTPLFVGVNLPSAQTTHSSAPELFKNKPFDTNTAPNRFGLPAFYSQHVWVWKHNPDGLVAMWNPRVSCKSVEP
jgi:hypothetical protein